MFSGILFMFFYLCFQKNLLMVLGVLFTVLLFTGSGVEGTKPLNYNFNRYRRGHGGNYGGYRRYRYGYNRGYRGFRRNRYGRRYFHG